MKKIKKAIALCVASITIFSLTGCNRRIIFDFVQKYDYAIIYLQNGEVIEGDIKAWQDYENGEQLQIEMEDGTIYLTNSFNCTLIRRG